MIAADVSGDNHTNVHSVSEIANKTGDSTDKDTVSGSLTFTDVDLTDTHNVSQATPTYVWSGGTLTDAQKAALTAAATLGLTEHDSTNTGTGSIDFNYSAADSNFDFLAAGETLKVTYNVTVADFNNGVANGTSSTQPVTITITGTNDTPVVLAENKAVADTSAPDAGHVVASGTAGTGGTGVLNLLLGSSPHRRRLHDRLPARARPRRPAAAGNRPARLRWQPRQRP